MGVSKDLNWGSKKIEGKKWYTVAFNSVVIPASHTTNGDDLDWDFNELRITSATYLASCPDEALEKAKENYPGSESGYTIVDVEDAYEPTSEERQERECNIADYYG